VKFSLAKLLGAALLALVIVTVRPRRRSSQLRQLPLQAYGVATIS